MAKKPIQIRVECEELEEWVRKAAVVGMSLSAWIRGRCNGEGEEAGKREIGQERLEKKKEAPASFWGKPAYQEHGKGCQCGICGFAHDAGMK